MDNRAALAIGLLVTAVSAVGCAAVNPARWAGSGPPCDDITFPVYFQEKSDALTPPAEQMLVMAAQKAKACKVAGVEVVGLSDVRDASPELSQLRAETVSRTLIANGLQVPRSDALGVAARTGDGRTQPMQRRTEVIIRLD